MISIVDVINKVKELFDNTSSEYQDDHTKDENKESVYIALDRIEYTLSEMQKQIDKNADNIANALRFTAIHKKQISNISSRISGLESDMRRALGYTSKNRTVTEGILSDIENLKDEVYPHLEKLHDHVQSLAETDVALHQRVSRTETILGEIRNAFHVKTPEKTNV